MVKAKSNTRAAGKTGPRKTTTTSGKQMMVKATDIKKLRCLETSISQAARKRDSLAPAAARIYDKMDKAYWSRDAKAYQKYKTQYDEVMKKLKQEQTNYSRAYSKYRSFVHTSLMNKKGLLYTQAAQKRAFSGGRRGYYFAMVRDDHSSR